ncbi:N-acetylmuramidase family protein [Tianweitania sp. BSSL-BM11]|uniref:N-acetylmuramidase family protein n=1 Tax=Tianweitania aestuarii TaxID=2814886 RepID=A0ABS5RVB6_9HYPH|nr:N-acetylmuramidase family protein [Tianweitania aestuarii]MBS9721008.1 N-acetylmuramidase family protein [Tianweitania aestuarii]
MFEPHVEAAIIKLAEANGLDPAALLAIAEVESGGKASARINDRDEPLIRFEGHYFDRRLSGLKRKQARAAGLSDPRAGAIRNSSSQAERWKMLRMAAAIDHQAAHESVSWGIGQVMGGHWRWLGYPSVEALVADCRESVAGQLRLTLRYCDKAGLMPAIRARNWAAFAKAYNGPAYATSRYDQKLAAAFIRHQKRLKQQTNAPSPAMAIPSQPQPRSLLQRLSDWLRRQPNLSQR